MKTQQIDVATAQKRIKRKSSLRNDLDAWILMLPMVIILYLFVWRPTVLGAVWSFFKMQAYTVKEFCGIDNYIKVISHTQFLPTLWNTVQYVLWSLIIGYLPPLFIAIMINEIVHFKGGFRVLIYIPAVIPGIAAMLMWYFMYYPDHTGLLNMVLNKMGFESFGWLNNPNFTILGIIIFNTWKGFAGTMLLYYASLQGVSVELYEAALIDGAGPFKRLWHVTRPAIEGLLLLNLVQQIIHVFQIMEQPLAMTGGGPNGASTSLGLLSYQYGFVSFKPQFAMATSVIMFILLIGVSVAYFRIEKKLSENI